MIHMLSIFDLTPGEDPEGFRAAHAGFVAALKACGLIVEAGPPGRRVDDTPMDTDAARPQRWVSRMSFRDRAQMDAAYDAIAERRAAATGPHAEMYRRITNGVFLCWEEPG